MVFLPTSLQVNRFTYPLHRLQQSLKNSIRLGVPPCTGRELGSDAQGPVFMALVISYIFKDRLKDISRGFLFNLFRRWLPDRRQDLFDGRNQAVGHCKESFRFMDWKALPETVREIRNRTHFVEILNSFRSEDILHYAKEVRIAAR